MAYNVTDKQEDAEIRAKQILMAATAQRILDEWERQHARVGGLTPDKLQEFVGQFHEITNPQFRVVPLSETLGYCYHVVRALESGKAQDEDVRELSAMIAICLMHVAYANAFDLYEDLYNAYKSYLEDAVRFGKEASEQERLANKPDPTSPM